MPLLRAATWPKAKEGSQLSLGPQCVTRVERTSRDLLRIKVVPPPRQLSITGKNRTNLGLQSENILDEIPAPPFTSREQITRSL